MHILVLNGSPQSRQQNERRHDCSVQKSAGTGKETGEENQQKTCFGDWEKEISINQNPCICGCAYQLRCAGFLLYQHVLFFFFHKQYGQYQCSHHHECTAKVGVVDTANLCDIRRRIRSEGNG